MLGALVLIGRGLASAVDRDEVDGTLRVWRLSIERQHYRNDVAGCDRRNVTSVDDQRSSGRMRLFWLHAKSIRRPGRKDHRFPHLVIERSFRRNALCGYRLRD